MKHAEILKSVRLYQEFNWKVQYVFLETICPMLKQYENNIIIYFIKEQLVIYGVSSSLGWNSQA